MWRQANKILDIVRNAIFACFVVFVAWYFLTTGSGQFATIHPASLCNDASILRDFVSRTQEGVQYTDALLANAINSPRPTDKPFAEPRREPVKINVIAAEPIDFVASIPLAKCQVTYEMKGADSLNLLNSIDGQSARRVQRYSVVLGPDGKPVASW